MKLTTQKRKNFLIVTFIFGLIQISLFMYDLIENWYTLSNFKLIFWPLQIFAWSYIIVVQYKQTKSQKVN